MELFCDFLSPITVLFLVACIGYYLGKIKLFGVSMDVAAVLLTAVLAGYLLSIFLPQTFNAEFNSAMTNFSKIGTALFVSSIGISTGSSITKSKKMFLYFVMGMLFSLAGFLSAKIIGFIDKQIDFSLLMGIMCGALTTTPGLAVLCESDFLSAELSTLGYSISYLFGVIGVVLFVQFLCKPCTTSNIIYEDNKKPIDADAFWIICAVSLLGQIISYVRIPFINVSLGGTVSILLCGIFFGWFLKRQNHKKIIFSSLSVYRNLGLILFFIGNGVTAGKNFNANIQIKWVLYGLIITWVSIIIGNFLCCFAKISSSYRSSIIAGGMTSTPAVGVILKKSAESFDVAGYSCSYFGALITVIICMKFLVGL